MAKLIQGLFSPRKRLSALRTISFRLLHIQAFSPRPWSREKTNIRITGEYIRAKVTQPIQKKNAFLSIIGDEVTDKYANQEILSVCLRFLGLNNDASPQIEEVFFDFANLDKTTGESIVNAIL